MGHGHGRQCFKFLQLCKRSRGLVLLLPRLLLSSLMFDLHTWSDVAWPWGHFLFNDTFGLKGRFISGDDVVTECRSCGSLR
jgi:hypothetical protein